MRFDKFQYSIQSSDWHGLSLVDIANEYSIPLDKVAEHSFYSRLYEKWQNNDFKLEGNWLLMKQKMSDIFYNVLSDLRILNQRIISLGAGLGIIEKGLIEKGVVDIELQECQGISFNYIKNFINPKIWITTDFRELPPASYKAVLTISLVYVFGNKEYENFFEQCARMITRPGYLIIWDHDIFLRAAIKNQVTCVKSLLLSLLKSKNKKAIAWGWLRTPGMHISIAEKHGFRLVKDQYFNIDLDPIENPPRLFGMQYPMGNSHAQMFVFEIANNE